MRRVLSYVAMAVLAAATAIVAQAEING